VNKNEPTQTHLKALTNFRQQAYALFEQQRAVLFELTDAIIQTPAARSFAELSLAPACTRQWPSLYSALADGALELAGLRALCLQQVPQTGARLHFALDVMAVRRLHSPTLQERVFCHGAQREVGGQGVIIGLPYSLLAYVAERGSSWAPAVHTQRVKPGESAVEVALTQVGWLAAKLPAASPPEIALDGGYGNRKFFAGLRGLRCFATARLRNDRVLYQLPAAPPSGAQPKPGRPPKYGAEFRCADPATWPAPDEVCELVDPQYGRVRLELWAALRCRLKGESLDIAVLRSQIHVEQTKPPAPHWYGVHNGTAEPTSARRVFECVTHRWPIEPANRFRKERLYAELPKLRTAESSDLWLQLVQVVEWELYLWRPAATDAHLPWQKPLAPEHLTPGRVLRSLGAHLALLGTPVAAVLPRGKAPGWPAGRPRAAPPRYRLESKRRKKALAMSKNE